MKPPVHILLISKSKNKLLRSENFAENAHSYHVQHHCHAVNRPPNIFVNCLIRKSPISEVLFTVAPGQRVDLHLLLLWTHPYLIKINNKRPSQPALAGSSALDTQCRSYLVGCGSFLSLTVDATDYPAVWWWCTTLLMFTITVIDRNSEQWI